MRHSGLIQADWQSETQKSEPGNEADPGSKIQKRLNIQTIITAGSQWNS